MDPVEIEKVQTTWAQLIKRKDDVADLFYERLFEADPSLRRLFPENLRDQKTKLMAMINVAVTKLPVIEQILPDVQALGRRHAGYGVSEAHYPVAGRALLETFETILGDEAFTPEVRMAWTKAYGALSGVMIQAAGEEAHGGSAGRSQGL